jgi:hypothetical protein
VLEKGDDHDGQRDKRDDDEGLPQPPREQGDGLLLHDPGVDGVGHDCLFWDVCVCVCVCLAG